MIKTGTPFSGLDNAQIFDFETLSTNRTQGVVLSLALLNFSENRFISMPYEYDELIENCHFIKFDVEDQVKNYGRKIDKDTLEWWNNQGPEAKKQLKPTDEDQSISTLHDFYVLNSSANIRKVYSRGNTFDPIIFEYIMEQTGYPDPYKFYEVRDTRSVIEGLCWGSELKNSFMPPDCKDKFVHHDPRHDVALDVMRLQTLVQAIS
jgi:hypothetical protein